MKRYIDVEAVKRISAAIMAESNDGGVYYGMVQMDREINRLPTVNVAERTDASDPSKLNLYQCFWKDRNAPIGTPPSCGFVWAEDEDDARRIMQENLDSTYEVSEVHPAQESSITPQSLTINFRNEKEYELF